MRPSKRLHTLKVFTFNRKNEISLHKNHISLIGLRISFFNTYTLYSVRARGSKGKLNLFIPRSSIVQRTFIPM